MTFDPFDPCEHSFSFPISEGSDSGTEDHRESLSMYRAGIPLFSSVATVIAVSSAA